MSRRKQPFPVRAEGNRVHLVIQPEASFIQKSKESDSKTILLDECGINIPTKTACSGSPAVLPNGEFMVTSSIYSESNVLAYEEQNFTEGCETKPQIDLPCVKVESSVIDEEQEEIVVPGFDESCVVKEEGFSVLSADEDEYEDITNERELQPLVGKSETQISLKTSEGQCIANIADDIEFHVEQLVGGSCPDDNGLEVKDPTEAYTEQENITDSKAHLQAILPCVEVDSSLFNEEPEHSIISPCKNSVPVAKESGLASLPFGEGKKCEKLVTVPELAPLCLSNKHVDYEFRNFERSSEVFTGFNIVSSLLSRTEITEDECSEDKAQKTRKNSTRKVYKKRRKTKESQQRSRAAKTNKQRQARTKPGNLLKMKEIEVEAILPCVDVDPPLRGEEGKPPARKDAVPFAVEPNLCSFPTNEVNQCENKTNTRDLLQMCLRPNHLRGNYEELEESVELSDDSTNNFELNIPESSEVSVSCKPCVTDEEIRCMVDFTEESLDEREKKLQQIREAVYRKRALETDEQRCARLEKDKLRQRKRRAEETEEQREKRLLTMRLHKRIKRSMHSSAGLQKNFLDYYMEEMFKYPETQEEQGSPLNMIVSIDPSWVVRTVEKQQYKCAVETEDQRKVRLEKDMLRQRKKRAEETAEQRAKRLETMRINKRIRRAMETEEQRRRRLDYSRERQLYRRLHETPEQRKERLEREKLRQREKRATESSEERALRLQSARERMRMRLSSTKVLDMLSNMESSDSSTKVLDMFDNLQSSDSLSS